MSENSNQNQNGDGHLPQGHQWDQPQSSWSHDQAPQAGSDPYGAAPQQAQPGQDPWSSAPQANGYQQAPGYLPQDTGYAAGQASYQQAYGYAPMAPAYASWGKRVQGWLLDWLVPSVVLNLLMSLIFPSMRDTSNLNTDASSNWPSMVVFLINALVLAFIMKDGQTPGRRWAKTRLVDANGQPVQGGGGAIGRYLLHILDEICFLGWLWPLWDSKRQTFADKVAKTYVVDDTTYQQQPQHWQ